MSLFPSASLPDDRYCGTSDGQTQTPICGNSAQQPEQQPYAAPWPTQAWPYGVDTQEWPMYITNGGFRTSEYRLALLITSTLTNVLRQIVRFKPQQP
jgi:hypothetical protein